MEEERRVTVEVQDGMIEADGDETTAPEEEIVRPLDVVKISEEDDVRMELQPYSTSTHLELVVLFLRRHTRQEGQQDCWA